jgi:hypothetical protein
MPDRRRSPFFLDGTAAGGHQGVGYLISSGLIF